LTVAQAGELFGISENKFNLETESVAGEV
jgi:hypothetical protein